LLFSPAWLFVVPGAVAGLGGLALTAVVALARVQFFGHLLQTHFALLGSALALLGVQVTFLGLFAKAIFVLDGIGRSAGIERFIGGFQLEAALMAGLLALVVGIGLDA